MVNQLTSDNGSDSVGQENDTDSQWQLLNRRNYLKLTGTAAAAAAGTGASGTAAAENYEIITVGAGETKRYDLRDGDTLENILFDITASQARVKIRPIGTDWIVRNIGFEGRLDLDGDGPKHEMIAPEVSDGRTGLIENVYLGDGATNDGGTGIFVPLDHAGTLIIRNCYFQH